MDIITVKSEQRHLTQDFRAHKQRDAAEQYSEQGGWRNHLIRCRRQVVIILARLPRP